ncbi:MAG: hypothetical protein HUJ73_08530 [Eubacterium sp.]|nr:hypothetical protein [Eubacterium sp.]
MALLYRKKALDRLSNPEQLDKMIVITPLPVVITVIIGIIVLVIFLLWALFGSVSKTISVEGFYLASAESKFVYYDGPGGTVLDCTDIEDTYLEEGNLLCQVREANGFVRDIIMDEPGFMYKWDVNFGETIANGKKIAEYRRVEDDGNAVIYGIVSLEDSKLLKTGMKVYAAPTYLDPEETGYIIGEISSVPDRIMTSTELMRLTENARLTDNILQVGNVVQIQCRMQKNISSENGYQWTKKKGEQITLTDMTPMNLMIETSSEAPIRYILKG